MTMSGLYGTDNTQNKVVLDAANDAFMQMYYQGKMSNEADTLSLAKAAQRWKEIVDTAAMTGEFNGNPTQAAMQFYANTFGSWAKPDMNAETLVANQQKFGQSVTAANLTGMFNGQQTQQAAKQAADLAAQQAGLTGWLQTPGQTGQGQQTLAGQQQQWNQGFQQQQAGYKAQQDYLQMLSGLRGPQDYGQYLKVLGSTPNGLQGLVSAAAGQYLPGTGSSGVAPTPASLGGFLNSAATGMSQQYAAQPNQYQYQGGQPQTGYQQAQGAQQTSLSQLQGQAQQQQPYTYGGPAGNNMQPAADGTSYQSYMAAAQGLPPPNQIAPQAYNAMTGTQKQLMGGMYEQLGYNLTDVADMYKQSLPKYGAQRSQVGGFKLQ